MYFSMKVPTYFEQRPNYECVKDPRVKMAYSFEVSQNFSSELLTNHNHYIGWTVRYDKVWTLHWNQRMKYFRYWSGRFSIQTLDNSECVVIIPNNRTGGLLDAAKATDFKLRMPKYVRIKHQNHNTHEFIPVRIHLKLADKALQWLIGGTLG